MVYASLSRFVGFFDNNVAILLHLIEGAYVLEVHVYFFVIMVFGGYVYID